MGVASGCVVQRYRINYKYYNEWKLIFCNEGRYFILNGMGQ
jgi:hypothetical protein